MITYSLCRPARILAAAFLLSALPLAMPVAAHAQQPDRAELASRIEEAKTRLNLSPEQERDLKALLREEGEALKRIRAGDGSRREKMQQAKAVQADFRPRLKKILDTTQLAEWDKMRDEVKQKARERRR
ncbi:hypothetical protein [Niveibacterium sp. SC-1]|uniref:hypothetical protein n=1 Tax=Niveibacterium sp. SC-1 TaxID=3135646 RepID=UPI00311F8710